MNKFYLSTDHIQFGTDGWRGVLGVDVTLEKLLSVSAAASQELAYRAPRELQSRTVIIGYDRRFLAPEFAEAIADAVRGSELQPLLTTTPVPTPSCSWAVVRHKALGALVVTASHNPPEWLGLKIKGPLGGSVDQDFTESVERRLIAGGITVPIDLPTSTFDARKEHLDGLRQKFDLIGIRRGLLQMGLKVIVDPMHGSAAGCIGELFRDNSRESIEEINSERDPLFGGNPPEPMAKYVQPLINQVRSSNLNGQPALGLVFDGDGDRLAAIDETGRFCSTQLLMPLLIDHLARVKQLPGCVVKTVSGSDLMQLVAEQLGREVLELPVGFKHIAEQMLVREVLIGGEESGGLGFGNHLPERDALFASLLLLEALTEDGRLLGERLDALKDSFGKSSYERIDLHLASMASRKKLEAFLQSTPPSFINNKPVKTVVKTDGVKLILDNLHWIMFRFSGTEPLLRIYCEAPTKEEVVSGLEWAKTLAEEYEQSKES